jgi:site-specific recombinase
MFHFTVATKQPAMTAAYLAEKLEHASNGSVNRKDLARLIVKVGRSQFAAILGNVAAALPVALIIGFAVNALTGSGVMKIDKAVELMQGQNAVTSLALFYAAVAGIWLFVSGLVAGYFDNRCLYLDLPARIRQHPLLERSWPPKLRHRFADYIGEHYGALWGNFFFGVMLGVTAYVGYLLSLPLDIRHVAFSVANVGYSSTITQPSLWVFFEFVFFALLIGVVNLTVSFIFALNVATRSRGIRLGSLRSIATACWREVRDRPWGLVLPPVAEPEGRQQHAQG